MSTEKQTSGAMFRAAASSTRPPLTLPERKRTPTPATPPPATAVSPAPAYEPEMTAPALEPVPDAAATDTQHADTPTTATTLPKPRKRPRRRKAVSTTPVLATYLTTDATEWLINTRDEEGTTNARVILNAIEANQDALRIHFEQTAPPSQPRSGGGLFITTHPAETEDVPLIARHQVGFRVPAQDHAVLLALVEQLGARSIANLARVAVDLQRGVTPTT